MAQSPPPPRCAKKLVMVPWLCGIFGCLTADSSASVSQIIRLSLKRLEYRGYDSAGIATLNEGKIWLKKDKGTLDEVHRRLNFDKLTGRLGIGHTRWATHGAPSQANAHPHTDCSGRVAVVHNGIIENYTELKHELEERGHIFTSKTDTEVIPHLVEEHLRRGASLIEAVRQALCRVAGSYALAVIGVDEPGMLVCARRDSPLMLGLGERAIYAASDLTSLLPWTNSVIELHNDEMAILVESGYEIRRITDWSRVARSPKLITWTAEMAEKGGFEHFMLKEIFEQPQSIKGALLIQDGYLDLVCKFLDRAKEIFLLAAGSSYYASLAGSYMFSKLARLPSFPAIASEFVEQYGEALNFKSVILAVSQSGETADVLKALDHARMKGATVVGLTNVIGSTLTRIARAYVCQQSGPEIGVAATKTFTGQLAVMAQLALRLGKIRGKLSQANIDDMQAKIEALPGLVEKTLSTKFSEVRDLARKCRDREGFYFFGKGISLATALEGRLKLLEIACMPSMILSDAWKQGIVQNGFPVVAVCPKDENRKALLENIAEMKSRGAEIISIAEEGDGEVDEVSDACIQLPGEVPETLSPIVYVVPLQMFAYHMAVERGYNPDLPRNLAKSVTVL